MSEEKNNSGIDSRVKPVEIKFKSKPVEISFKHDEKPKNKELTKSNTLPKKVLSAKVESIEVDEEKLKKLSPNADKKVLKLGYYQPKKNHFKLEVIFLKIWKY